MKHWRLLPLLFFTFLVAAIIIGRLFYVQVINGKFYQSQALGQQMGFTEIIGERGEVFFESSKDSRGAIGLGDTKSLAINKESWIISAVPKNIKDMDYFAQLVGEPLSMTKKDILAKVVTSSSYVVLKKGVTTQVVEVLKKLKLEGLSFEKSTDRYYPQEKLASQVIGFLGGENEGQYGLEGHYNDILKGKAGIKEEKRGFDLIYSPVGQEGLNGSDVYVTIDYNIQFQAEALLKEAKKNIDIDSGQIIVLKPDSGRILAMANFPQFDPNTYGKERDFGIFQNSAVQKVFEPGSVFKPFTMAMGLQEGKITPDATFTDTGSIKIGPDTLYNFDREKYGLQTMSGILEKSINTGAVYVEQKIPHTTFFDYLNRLGFNDKTEVDLQGEVSSSNARLKSGSEFDYATSSFGQGIEMTPLQLVKAFCIFANGGRIPKPYVAQKITYNQNQNITKPQLSEQIISEKTAFEVTKMLMNVVDKGFGSSAKIKGYYLAGKTGTAEVPITNGKGYYADRTIQSFIGFGPALKPEFLVLVKLDNPKVPKSSLSAAPIFKKMAQYIINYWQIPPDYPVSTQ